MKKVVKILLLTIMVVGLFTGIKHVIVSSLMENANYGLLALEKQGTDTLFIGSSMFRQGINTKELDTDENKTFLLSYNGFQPYAEYTSIKEVLANIDIDTLIIDMYAYSLASNVGMADTRLWQGMPLSFTIDLFTQMHEHGGSEYSVLYEMVIQANNESFITWPITFRLINSRYYRGSNTATSTGMTEKELEKNQSQLPERITLNEYQVKALKNIIELCKGKGIKVLFVETPKYKNIYESNSYIDGFQQYLDLVKEWGVECVISSYTAKGCRTYDNVIVYEFDSSNASYFTDWLHISGEGRNILSDILIPILNKSDRDSNQLCSAIRSGQRSKLQQ